MHTRQVVRTRLHNGVYVEGRHRRHQGAPCRHSRNLKKQPEGSLSCWSELSCPSAACQLPQRIGLQRRREERALHPSKASLAPQAAFGTQPCAAARPPETLNTISEFSLLGSMPLLTSCSPLGSVPLLRHHVGRQAGVTEDAAFWLHCGSRSVPWERRHGLHALTGHADRQFPFCGAASRPASLQPPAAAMRADATPAVSSEDRCGIPRYRCPTCGLPLEPAESGSDSAARSSAAANATSPTRATAGASLLAAAGGRQPAKRAQRGALAQSRVTLASGASVSEAPKAATRLACSTAAASDAGPAEADGGGRLAAAGTGAGRRPSALRCAAGHSVAVARQGHVHLLPRGRLQTGEAGDNEDMVTLGGRTVPHTVQPAGHGGMVHTCFARPQVSSRPDHNAPRACWPCSGGLNFLMRPLDHFGCRGASTARSGQGTADP